MLMLVFVIFAIALEAFYAGVLSWDKLLVAIVALCCPLFAISTTFGIWSMAGLRTNSAMLIMPLLYRIKHNFYQLRIKYGFMWIYFA